MESAIKSRSLFPIMKLSIKKRFRPTIRLWGFLENSAGSPESPPLLMRWKIEISPLVRLPIIFWLIFMVYREKSGWFKTWSPKWRRVIWYRITWFIRVWLWLLANINGITMCWRLWKWWIMKMWRLANKFMDKLSIYSVFMIRHNFIGWLINS